jgi:putative redox protein
MKKTLSGEWMDGMAFRTEVNGHELIMDADGAVGGKDRGPRPKPLMEAALMGCTAMDVISILKKMRVEVESFKIDVETEMTEEHPKHYSHMHLIYRFKGKDLPMDKLEKAVNLSQDRYCGVSYMYRQAMKLTHEIVLED